MEEYQFTIVRSRCSEAFFHAASLVSASNTDLTYDCLVLFCSRILDRGQNMGPKKIEGPKRSSTLLVAPRSFLTSCVVILWINGSSLVLNKSPGASRRLVPVVAPPQVPQSGPRTVCWAPTDRKAGSEQLLPELNFGGFSIL